MLLDHGRETVGTTALDADPDAILRMPGDSLAPLLLAAASTALCVGLLLHWPWLSALAIAGAAAAAIVWLWPQASLLQTTRNAHD
jgi:cytochrome c oxidase subunit I+III